jgi:hypothetical protein
MSSAKRRWGQMRRLSFIETRLQYDGRINRGDLEAFFGISTPQASADLKLYQGLAPNNLAYDSKQRVYVSHPEFHPLFGRTSATRYLGELSRLAREEIEEDESFVGFVPRTGVVATPARAIDSAEVAVLVRSIRDRTVLRVRYQSMDQPSPLVLILSPHAFGFDGLRWHIRAFCHRRGVFRDFAIGRLAVEGYAREVIAADPAHDAGWETQVPLVLVPHSRLSPAQREIVMHDYSMTNGQLVMKCRKAMLFYTLRHLNLEALEESEHAAQQHVVVANVEDVRRWCAEDRAGEVNAPVEEVASIESRAPSEAASQFTS